MTYADELDRLTRHVADLVATSGEPIDEPAVQAALSGRKALLGLLTVQLQEVAPRQRSSDPPDFVAIAASPVAALSATLHAYPRPHGEAAPSELLRSGQTTQVGRLWVELGRSATAAQAEWQSPGAAIDEDQAWAIVADTAILAKALTRLDNDLAAVAPQVGCEDLTASLSSGEQLALRVAADAAYSVAVAGPLASEAPHRKRQGWPRIVAATDPVSFIGAIGQVAEILDRSGPVKPEHVQQIAVALSRCSLKAATGAASTGLASQEGLWAKQATALADVARTSRRAAMCPPADPRPLLQSGEIARFVRSHASTVRQSAELAQAVASAVISLDRRVRRDLAQGHWLVPEEREDARFHWRQWRPGMPLPPIVDRIGSARQVAEEMAVTVPSRRTALLLRPHRLPDRVDAAAPSARPTLPAFRPSR